MATVRERNKKVIVSLTLQDPTAEQRARLDAIRRAAQVFAKVIVKNTEEGHESSLAQDAIVEATQRAVRSVIFEIPLVPDGEAEPVVKAARKTVAKKAAAPVKKAVKRKSV